LGTASQRPWIAGEWGRRGRELRLAAAPGCFYLAADLPLERTKNKNDLAPPPQTHVRKKLEPEVPSGNQRAADFALNGQRVGELQESFWTAAWRLITRLESAPR
jgi:hypothetical protein